MMTFPRFGLLASALALAALLLPRLQAAEPARPARAAPRPIRFNRDIRPILSNHCSKCHGPDLKKAGLDLQTRAAAVKELKSGHVAIVPGKSDESELIERVTSPSDGDRMPPASKGPRLSEAEIARLRAWIDQGAPYEEHWAYVKPVRRAPPPVKDPAWVRNEIDAFVLARLEKEGLAPSPEADRATLIRRVSLDLTGLPPTVAEVDAFLADNSPDAYDKVVRRLLASPHYGEHQARFWLDQARYADTNGYEKDERRTMWPYRDWVIAAFNRDLPFDRFTIEQLAGDLLPNATTEQKIATGFHRNTMVNTEGGTDDEEFRVAAVVDRVNTTMEVWMGTTIGCAQCHNHKYDPFAQKEYYQLFAFFNSTEDRGRTTAPLLELPTSELIARRAKLRQEIARREAVLNTPSPQLAAAQEKWEQGLAGRPAPAPVAPLLAVAPSARTPAQKEQLARYYRSIAPELNQTRQQVAALRKQEAALRPVTTMVLKELPAPRPTHVQIRGNHKNLGEKVSPGVPASLHPLAQGQPANRLALARWLVDPANPLVGRVTMNRIWARSFGRGFVETSEDFGAQGEPPTHPELLDWLATEFVRQKWSLKAMHRLIVTSATYRQSSRVTPELYRRDQFNRLFARGPRFRLAAEMVRDNALAVSGLLCRKIGGPSVFPYQPDGVWFNPYSGDRWVTSPGGDQYRRGLYTFWRRTAPYAAFMAFDAPSREVCTERRPRTNTPLQALATLNDKAFVQPAAALARRMMAEAKGDDAARAVHGFRLCLARKPSAAELDLLLHLYRENLAKYRSDPAGAKALATSELPEPPKEMNLAELAAWTVVANVLLNLDETITKG